MWIKIRFIHEYRFEVLSTKFHTFFQTSVKGGTSLYRWTESKAIDITIEDVFYPGALAKKSCQPGKNEESWNFQESCLGAHLIPWWKSPPKIPVDEFFCSRWPPSPLVASCYTLNHVNFLIFVIERQFWGAYPWLEKTENTVESLFHR